MQVISIYIKLNSHLIYKPEEPDQASLSLQEKIKQQLKRRASHRGSSRKKSGRSGSLSSESSCSVVTRDDSYSVDDRSGSGRLTVCFTSRPHDQHQSIIWFSFPGRRIQMKLLWKPQLLHFLSSPLPSTTQSASQENNWPPERCKAKRTAQDTKHNPAGDTRLLNFHT